LAIGWDQLRTYLVRSTRTYYYYYYFDFFFLILVRFRALFCFHNYFFFIIIIIASTIMKFSIKVFATAAFLLPAAVSSATGYEVWAADQSNAVSGQGLLGVMGSFLWIWDSNAIETQLAGGPTADPLSCTSSQTGPCDILDVFPAL